VLSGLTNSQDEAFISTSSSSIFANYISSIALLPKYRHPSTSRITDRYFEEEETLPQLWSIDKERLMKDPLIRIRCDSSQ
jgi:hypothetical protein